jgi:hypothetical protein
LGLLLFAFGLYASDVLPGINKRVVAVVAAVAIGTLAIVAAVPAQAGTSPGWRQVFSKGYGAGTYPAFETVVATSAANAWVLGGSNVGGGPDTPIAEHWNGKAWSSYTLPKVITDDVIVSASAPAANDIWAVAQFGGFILHWNGKAWSVAKRLAVPKGISVAPQLTGVVALSATDVWAFGSSGFTLGWGTWHYNGKSWTQWHGNAADITDGSALSAANIWAIGGPLTPQSEIVHYTGSWKLVTASALSGLRFDGIQAFTSTDVWASAVSATNEAQSWLVHYDGRGWSRLRLPWNVSLDWGHIVSDGRGGLWLSALGQSTAGPVNYEVHHTASGAWSRTRVAAELFNLASIPGTASVWGAGGDFALPPAPGKAVVWAYGPV